MHAIKLKVKKASGDYDVGCSKMLGDPVLPEGMLEELPPTAMFLMQIKLEDIKDLDVENKLPHKGYLYFFLDGEPKVHVTAFNEAVEGFEEFNKDFIIEFEKCDESDTGNKLLGCPGDWQFSEEPAELLFQLDPMDSDEMGLFPTFDGMMYFFFGKDKRDFGAVSFVEDFS